MTRKVRPTRLPGHSRRYCIHGLLLGVTTYYLPLYSYSDHYPFGTSQPSPSAERIVMTNRQGIKGWHTCFWFLFLRYSLLRETGYRALWVWEGRLSFSFLFFSFCWFLSLSFEISPVRDSAVMFFSLFCFSDIPFEDSIWFILFILTGWVNVVEWVQFLISLNLPILCE